MSEYKQIEFKEDIGIFKNVFPKDFCSHIIAEYNRLESDNSGFVVDRRLDEGELHHRKNDTSIHMSLIGQELKLFKDTDSNGNPIDRDVTRTFFKGLHACLQEYVGKYSILDLNKLRGSSMKVQRTLPGGGYHIWHCERGTPEVAARELVYMLYLNTIPVGDGGETEFLYKKLRITPEENTVLIWPAGFTHAHRGNMVLGEEAKYVITGWVLIE